MNEDIKVKAGDVALSGGSNVGLLFLGDNNFRWITNTSRVDLGFCAMIILIDDTVYLSSKFSKKGLGLSNDLSNIFAVLSEEYDKYEELVEFMKKNDVDRLHVDEDGFAHTDGSSVWITRDCNGELWVWDGYPDGNANGGFYMSNMVINEGRKIEHEPHSFFNFVTKGNSPVELSNDKEQLRFSL